LKAFFDASQFYAIAERILRKLTLVNPGEIYPFEFDLTGGRREPWPRVAAIRDAPCIRSPGGAPHM
jgi:hypothetical protein